MNNEGENHDLLARPNQGPWPNTTILPHYPDTNPGLPGWKDYDPGTQRPVREGPITIGTSTLIDKTPPLTVGEEWYIRFPGARALSHVIIADVTPKTVLVKSASFFDNNGSRYEKKDIDFVERCKAVEPKVTTSE